MTDAPSPRCSSGSPEARQFRQLLIHTICPHIKQWSDAEDVPQFGCEKCPATVETSLGTGVPMCRLNAEKAADAVLGILDVAQASTGPREVLDALADKVSAKIAQLKHYKANDAQLDHAKTIAEGRISQANQILHWIAESAIRHTASPPAALPAETVTVPLEALRNCGCPADFRATVGQCEDSGQCGCSINLKGRAVSSTSRATPDPTRCEVCDWPLAENREKGCVPGDCSYRPDDPAEQERIRRRRQQISSTDLGSGAK